MRPLSPRGRLIRDAIIYTPLFAACLLFAALMLTGLIDFAIVGFIILVGVCFLFGYQCIQSLRDLRRAPEETNGIIARRWTKRDGFLVKSHYISVARTIFRVPVESYMELQAEDSVRVVAFPHTGTVVSVERTGRPEQTGKTGPTESRGRGRTLRTARRDTPRRSGDDATGDSPS